MDKHNKGKREKKMESALAKKYPNLDIKIDYTKLLSDFEIPKIKDGTIILNPDNPAHRKWFELEDGENEE